MKLKKITALLLTAAMIGTLGACGQSSTSDSSASGSAADTTAAKGDSKSDEKVKLTFMGWEASPLETAAVKQGIAAFEKQYPNITVSYTPSGSGSDYLAKLLSTVVGDSTPDVFFIGAADYRSFAAKNTLLDITDRFNEEFPIDDFIDSSRSIMDIDGKIYGVSSCTVSPIIYYNKDLFDKAGIEYPSSDPANCWTIDEFRDTAKKLTKDGIYGCYGLETVADTLSAQILSGGGTRFNEDFTKSTMNTPEVKKVFQTILDIREKDGSAPAATTLDNAGMTAKQMLSTGKVAMLMDGSWSLQELSTLDFNIGMAPLPSYGKVMTTGQAHLHAISAMSKHKDEAWEFVKFLSGMDYQGELVSQGLWMPNRKSMYEADAVAQWYKDDVHGTDYKNMLEYFQNAQVDPVALQKSSKCTDIIKEETDKYFKDGQDIDTTLQNIDTRIDEELARVTAQ